MKKHSRFLLGVDENTMIKAFAKESDKILVYYELELKSRSASSEFLSVSSLPGGSNRWSSVMGSVSLLSETSVFLTGGGKSSKLSLVVLLVADPIDSGILSNGGVVWINADNLEEFVGSVLTNPVRVEDSQVGASSTDLLLSNRSVGSSFLELSDTLMDWLSVDNTLVDSSLSSSSSDSDSVENVSLLSLESEGSGLIESGWSLDLVDNWKLSVFPASNSHDKSDDIRLLLSPKFLEVLVGTHYLFVI